MLPVQFYEELARAKRQARAMRNMDPATISVDTWLGGYRAMFPDARSDETIHEQQLRLMPFRRIYGSQLMSAITPIQAQAWTLKHKRQVKLLKCAWDRAVLMQVAPINPWLFVVYPERTKEKRRAPTDAELETVLLNCRARDWPEFERLVVVAAHTGARRAGLVGLRCNDVDLERGRMTLIEKGDKTREVIVPEPALEALATQVRLSRTVRYRRGAGGAKSPHVWAAKRDISTFSKPLSAKYVSKSFAQTRGDFPHGFHSLRHYAAGWLLRQGIDRLDVAVQLGHTDAHGRPYDRLVERVYTRPDPEDALRRIQEAVR